MSRLVLGVDGGNTKSHYALFDEEGTSLAFIHGGPSCHDTLPDGYHGMRRELAASFEAVLSPLGHRVSDLDHATLGLAGTDTDEHHQTISAILNGLGLPRFRLVNDAFLGIKAGTSEGWGLCSINGTGTVTAAVDPDGTSFQVGGQGYFSGDEGGGGVLAERVVRAVYDARYRCGPPTLLTDLLVGALGLQDVRELFGAYVDRSIPLITLTKAGFQADREGDEVARNILVTMGRNAGESTLGAARQVRFPSDRPVEVVLAGSLFVKADSATLVAAFKDTVRQGLGDRAKFVVLQEPPVAGAVLWSLEDLRGPLPRELRERVLGSLRSP